MGNFPESTKLLATFARHKVLVLPRGVGGCSTLRCPAPLMGDDLMRSFLLEREPWTALDTERSGQEPQRASHKPLMSINTG